MTRAETINDYLTRRAAEVNQWLDALVPSESTAPERLHRAMRINQLVWPQGDDIFLPLSSVFPTAEGSRSQRGQ